MQRRSGRIQEVRGGSDVPTSQGLPRLLPTPGAGRGRGTLLQVPRERGPAHTSISASWPLELRESLFLLFGVLFQCREGGGALELAVLARKAKYNAAQIHSHTEVNRLALGPDGVHSPLCFVLFLQLYGAITYIPYNSAT